MLRSLLVRFNARRLPRVIVATESAICSMKVANRQTMIPAKISSGFPSKYEFQQKRFAAHQPFTIKTVQERIMLVLNLYDKIDNEKLTMDSDFFKDLGLDSLDYVEVILAMEDEFQFEIPDGDSDRFRTPRDIYQYICDKCDVYE